jgi:hypothetical protein
MRLLLTITTEVLERVIMPIIAWSNLDQARYNVKGVRKSYDRFWDMELAQPFNSNNLSSTCGDI